MISVPSPSCLGGDQTYQGQIGRGAVARAQSVEQLDCITFREQQYDCCSRAIDIQEVRDHLFFALKTLIIIVVLSLPVPFLDSGSFSPSTGDAYRTPTVR